MCIFSSLAVELVKSTQSECQCRNNGTCVTSSDSSSLLSDEVSCVCPWGFGGMHCELLTNVCELLLAPCSNHGTCFPNTVTATPITSSSNYTCICEPDFEGVTCDQQRQQKLATSLFVPPSQAFGDLDDACIMSPCQNGATCRPGNFDSASGAAAAAAPAPSVVLKQKSEHVGGAFHCECALGYHGVTCERDIDVCQFDMCHNNAQCIDGPGANFTCICPPGFAGRTCQNQIATTITATPSPPPPQPTTTEVSASTTSEIPASRNLGAICEQKSNPCLNGGICRHSTSLDPEENFVCQCGSDFTGPHCETGEHTHTHTAYLYSIFYYCLLNLYCHICVTKSCDPPENGCQSH